MFYKLSTLVLFLMLAAPGVALAQGTGTLAGTVVDDLGDPLPGANVQLSGTTLGAATDFDGNYRIIGVPVGNYDVTASFVGYQSVTQSGVDVSSGYTRELNFELSEGTVLGDIIVEYERPLIQKDAIGVPKVISGEDIENLPVRGVTEVAALQGSVVAEGNGDDLFIRGGRNEEVAYYVDGVKVSSLAQVAVNQQAIQEQEMLIGTIPPRYGDVQSGVISITTKSGADKFFGSAEIITSEVLDDYGYNLGSLSIGGPLWPGRASFFLSAQGELIADDSPYGAETFQLTDDAFAALQQNPQVLRVRDRNTGEETTVNFPVQQIEAALAEDPDFEVTPTAVQGFVQEQFAGQYQILDSRPLSAPNFYTADQFERTRGKDDRRDEFTLNGNVTLNLPADMNLRVGGAFNVSDRQSDFFTGDFFSNSLYNRDKRYDDERRSFRTYGTLRQRFGDRTFYQVQGEFQDYNRVLYPNGFSSSIGDDFLSYGALESDPYYEVARRYYQFNSQGTNTPADDRYEQQFATNGASLPGQAGNFTFTLPGAGPSGSTIRYLQDHNQQLRFSGNLTTQLSVHQIEIGGEFESETRRRFQISPFRLAGSSFRGSGFSDDPTTPRDESLLGYDEITYQNLEPLVTYYGYNYNGTSEVDDESVEGFFTFVPYTDPVTGEIVTTSTGDTVTVRQNTNMAPYKPLYYAGYVQDKIEFGDLVIQLGARVDVFDNNSILLNDIYAPEPVVRAEDLTSCNGRTTGENVPFDCAALGNSNFDFANYSRPGGIEDDYAVYFNQGGSGSTVVGYRDLDGNFYFADGSPTLSAAEIVNSPDAGTAGLGGQVKAGTLDLSTFDDVFGDYDPQVTFMPRLGVSFPVTDQTLFFASYNVTSQRPTERAFTPFRSFVGLTGQSSRTANPALVPEKTTQYELGFRQRINQNAALTLSGFYRTQENKITNRPVTGGFPSYGTYFNQDFTTTKGLEMGFDLRRTQNLALNANYTLSFAEGTGSDAAATALIVWRGTQFPNSLNPADFDQRHTLNASADYRLGEDEGPMVFGARVLENFGINLLYQFGSGQRYTRIEQPNPNDVSQSFTSDVRGRINEATLPATNRIDLRVDRSFNLGFAGTSLKAYLWVQNVLDTQNVIAVYRATGLPDEDGYLELDQGVNYLDTTEGSAEGFAFNYGAYSGGPVNLSGAQASGGGFFYGLPRRVRLGLLFNF